ncbi:MAG: hypothetical protein C207_06994 [Bradyrhizobium sp. DFCI-1]|jgi:hypothetical protein|nr:MAG: hypothetical protein C207_06994 [Bradyrhizobium sp. DFCI-1]
MRKQISRRQVPKSSAALALGRIFASHAMTEEIKTRYARLFRV